MIDGLRRMALLCCVVFCLAWTTGCGEVAAVGVGAQRAEPSQLRGDLSGALLLDVRTPEEFTLGHIAGSVNVPPGDLDGYLHALPKDADKPVVIVCRSDYRASLAYPVVKGYGLDRVFVLDGGIVRWQREQLPLETGPASGDVLRAPPVRTLSWAQQLVAFLAGGIVKPTYMLLSLLLAWSLRRASAPDLRLLFHGVLWFFVGEAFCAINYYFHGPGWAQPIDLLHGAGMVAMSALIPWGLFRLLDDRVLHFSTPDKACGVQRLCGRCWKRDAVRCGPHDVMLLLAPALALVALMPLSADLLPLSFVTEVFGSQVDYGLPTVNHFVELRVYPVVGSILLAAAFALLWGSARSIRRAEPVFFAGFGFMAYAAFRHLLVNTHREELWWADFWEESTELLLVLFLGMLLVVFRRQLGLVGVRGAADDAKTAGERTG